MEKSPAPPRRTGVLRGAGPAPKSGREGTPGPPPRKPHGADSVPRPKGARSRKSHPHADVTLAADAGRGRRPLEGGDERPEAGAAADSLDPGQLLHVLRLAGPRELRRLEVVHNVRLHAGHVQQLLAQGGFPRLVSLTLPAKAFDAPPASTPASDGEEPLLASIAWALSRMTQLTELHVAFSTLTGKLQTLLG